ncbi:hypothetical protein [Pedobacter sp. NJ-S-72]
MYVSGDYIVLMALAIGGAGTLVLGLLLSIIVFFTKKKAAEIVAWICGGFSLVVYLASLTMGAARQTEWYDLYLIAILLIFVLLLQYRSKFVQQKNIKKISVIKTALIVLTFDTICKCAINVIIASNTGFSDMGSVISVIYTMLSILSWVIITICCIWYLNSINTPLLRNEIFKLAVLFNWPVYLLIIVLNFLLFVFESAGFSSGLHLSMLLNRHYLLNQLGMLLFGGAISAIIATSIYFYNKTAKHTITSP